MAIRIGFVGAGQMAQALGRAFVQRQVAAPADIVAVDCLEQACHAFREVVGAQAETDFRLLNEVDAIILAVKPQHIPDVAGELSVNQRQLLVSIAAGVTISRLSEWFQTERIVRVMPNTPCLVGKGASAYCLAEAVLPNDADLVERLLAAVGTVVRLPESLMDAVTGLSGSGPAFVYQFIEALSDGGVRAGLPRVVATQLATQTVLGAAAMVLETGEHPALLKDRVASPNGTTIAGLYALEKGGFRSTVMAAVDAATRRSAELGMAGRDSR
jgi:pyrroline-5-carboxylate reductase